MNVVVDLNFVAAAGKGGVSKTEVKILGPGAPVSREGPFKTTANCISDLSLRIPQRI